MTLINFFSIDSRAVDFYSNYYFMVGRSRETLEADVVKNYYSNVSVLKACYKLIQHLQAKKCKDVFAVAFNQVQKFKKELIAKHNITVTLPNSEQWFYNIYNAVIDKNGNADYEAIMQKRRFTHTRQYGRF